VTKPNIAAHFLLLIALAWLPCSWSPCLAEHAWASGPQGSLRREGLEEKTQAPHRPARREINDISFAAASAPIRVIIFGDSIAAGYGVDQNEAFPAQLQAISDREGARLTIINAGLSGETSAGGARRIGWVLKQPADILLIELGGNDALRGLPISQLEKNLRDITTTARSLHPKIRVLLAGMRAPPNLGEPFASEFASVYPRLASELNLNLIPFVLEGVGGVAELNQADGIHPTPEGHKRIAEQVWPYLAKEAEYFSGSDSKSSLKKADSLR
jgi:acyl-CoA thioesterase-1